MIIFNFKAKLKMYRRKCTYRVLRAQRKKRNCISRESDSDSNSSNLSDYSISTSSSKSSSSYHLRDESLLNLSDTSKESTEDISTLVMSTLCSKEVIFIAALLLYAIQAGISNNSDRPHIQIVDHKYLSNPTDNYEGSA